MTLEEESRLSFYRELTVLDEKKNIVLVQDIRNSELCVKKTLDIYSHDVYEQLASIRIEGVPAVKECVADDGKLIVVEEYVQGRSLKQVLDEHGLLNAEQAYEIAVQLADVLVRLHQLEPAIVHRDIKPSNIIIEKNGHVNLIDFNAARHVNAEMQIRMKIPECWEPCILLHQSSLDSGSLMSVLIYMVLEQQLIIL